MNYKPREFLAEPGRSPNFCHSRSASLSQQAPCLGIVLVVELWGRVMICLRSNATSASVKVMPQVHGLYAPGSSYPSMLLKVSRALWLGCSVAYFVSPLVSGLLLFKSLRLRPPTPEAYGKTADFGTLCIPGSSQRRDPSAAPPPQCTPRPSKVASTGFINFSMALLPSLK